MRRIAAIIMVSFMIGFLSPSVSAQQATKVARVGWLAGGSQPAFQHLVEAFRAGMRDLGYVEGQHFNLEIRAAEGRFDRLPQLAAEFERGKVDVILVGATAPLRAAREATTTIPIVMASVGDPVGTGFIASLERPGGNITGVAGGTIPQTTILELIKEIVPRPSRLAVLVNPLDGAAARGAKNWEATASAAGIELRRFDVDKPEGFDDAFAAMAKTSPDAVIVVPDALFFSSRSRIVQLAAKQRLPAFYYQREYVEAGGLMAYGFNLTEYFRRSATHVDKILKGADPAVLPVEVPTKGELALNVRTAKALGLALPQSLRSKADYVVE